MTTVVLDVDATLVTAHSEKEQAAANFKGGFGFHPLGVWCDNTGELLAIRLRPGNANANHAQDHIDLLGEAISQIPAAASPQRCWSGPTRPGRRIRCWTGSPNKVRSGAGRWSTRSDSPCNKGIAVHDAIHTLPEPAWTAALDADGEARDGAQVAELTGLLDLAKWPAGMRVIVRREKPHPGAGLTLFEQADGWRYQAFATNTTHRSARRSWRPGTEPTPGSRTASGSPRTPASAGSRRGSSPSTRCGSRSPRSPPT